MKPFEPTEAPYYMDDDCRRLEAGETEVTVFGEAETPRPSRPARPCVVCGAALPTGRKKTHLGACRQELRRRTQQSRRRRRR